MDLKLLEKEIFREMSDKGIAGNGYKIKITDIVPVSLFHAEVRVNISKPCSYMPFVSWALFTYCDYSSCGIIWDKSQCCYWEGEEENENYNS